MGLWVPRGVRPLSAQIAMSSYICPSYLVVARIAWTGPSAITVLGAGPCLSHRFNNDRCNVTFLSVIRQITRYHALVSTQLPCVCQDRVSYSLVVLAFPTAACYALGGSC